ncbi:MAG: glycosyltransferase [bacterium]
MTALLISFVAVAGLLWLSVFGYLLLLGVLAQRRVPRRAAAHELPRIAVVMATLNEAARIPAKLADLARTDYPRDRLRIVIVDGRSTDGTREMIEAARRDGAPIELLWAPQTNSKLEQLRRGLESVDEELVVATDADAQLDPGCIRALIELLLHDPTTAVVGARVRPASQLLEERIYWWFLNTLWWLEGEALSAAVVSGVCYAVRRRIVLEAPRAAGADDILFALAAGAHGHGVRLCRTAWAIENRVPQTAAEFITFRRRRGAGYFGALRAPLPAAGISGWRLARAVRLFHFLVTPAALGVLVLTALALCWTPHWRWPIVAAAAFALPALAALFASSTLAGMCKRRWHLGLAAARLVVLTWVALLGTSHVPPSAPARVDPQPDAPLRSVD